MQLPGKPYQLIFLNMQAMQMASNFFSSCKEASALPLILKLPH